METGTGARTETREVAEMETGTKMKTGTGTRIGSGRAEERRRSARNHSRVVNLGGKRKKNVEKKSWSSNCQPR